MTSLKNKHILLIVTGGIAAYKSVDLIRQLRSADYEVRVVMTEAAQTLITPLTFKAISGYPPLLDWKEQASSYGMDHIALARWADVILIAPATADFMAKLAHGMANDIASTLCLAADVPIIVVPAMNQQMWFNPATQANHKLLESRGYSFIGPCEGSQACGEEGPGRMEEPANILLALNQFFTKTQRLQGLTIVITAGPTQEAIDPVRFISNHSSGKMGYALAAAAENAGAKVILISGPTALTPPKKVEIKSVVTAQEMLDAVMQDVAQADIFIAVAAVADYRPVSSSVQKIKKTGEDISLILQQNPDILAEVSALNKPPFMVGFAAETEDLQSQAQKKLAAKKLDMIAANLVSQIAGFNVDENALLVLWNGGSKEFSLRSKQLLAQDLIELIAERYPEANSK